MHAHGNLIDHEYEIEQDVKTIATVSKKWFRTKEMYAVESKRNQDDALLLAVTVCIDAMTRSQPVELLVHLRPGALCGVLSRAISLAMFIWQN